MKIFFFFIFVCFKIRYKLKNNILSAFVTLGSKRGVYVHTCICI